MWPRPRTAPRAVPNKEHANQREEVGRHGNPGLCELRAPEDGAGVWCADWDGAHPNVWGAGGACRGGVGVTEPRPPPPPPPRTPEFQSLGRLPPQPVLRLPGPWVPLLRWIPVGVPGSGHKDTPYWWAVTATTHLQDWLQLWGQGHTLPQQPRQSLRMAGNKGRPLPAGPGSSEHP